LEIGSKEVLKTVVFALRKSARENSQVWAQVEETINYIKENGYDAVYVDVDSEEALREALSELGSDETLVISDSGEDAEYLSDKGFYVVGLWHELNKGERFKELKYIFSELTEIDIDSFVKTYQRYAGEPWEVLRTDRLIIRETTIEDIDEFYKLYADPEMTRYMEGLFEDPEDEKRYQRDYINKVYGLMGFGVWTLVRASDNTIIGRAGYSIRNGFEEIELGFLVGTQFQRQGYAFEACKAILDYGRDMLQFDKVQTLVKKENKVSIHLCEKLGFTFDEEVEVEENIYGRSYDGQKVPFDKSSFGKYVKMSKSLW
jgi:RimJ/RimL family protein N-acetyltransferase